MADRPISELTEATTVTDEDMFVLQQSNRAMKLTGRVFRIWALDKMRDHGGIHSIEKTATSGLEDTYTITFADESTYDYTVDNGRSITDIEKTDTEVLVDTYTISFNDNTTFDFNVTNGNSIDSIVKIDTTNITDTYRISFSNGDTLDYEVINGKGIVSIEKTNTNVLTDTYTITYNDTTTSSFNVVNGRSITQVAKTSTVGLVDTYTISYNDNTSSTFTVSNGEKGDNAYTWVKYSTNQPTQDSDMHDSPDNWIGISIGYSSTAPTTYTSYNWFMMKGDKGDPGDDLTVTGVTVEYGVTDSQNTQPSSWYETFPVVPQGMFLWTRVTLHFNAGTDNTYIASITRQGQDGSGTVSSVNGVSPTGTDVDLIDVSGTTLVIKRGVINA